MPSRLAVRDLSIAFPSAGGEVTVVRGVDLDLASGEIVGLVGESGSGKSLSALATLGLVPAPGRIARGSIQLDGRELVGLPERELRPIRGRRLGLVFQEPSAALNPVLTIGTQIVEAIRAHRRVGRAAARARARDLLARLAVPDPDRRLREYPHQLSGGQRQRALIAIALAAEPDLLIADEPTTALDVTVQAQVLELFRDLRRDLGLGILLVTHDLAVVAETCDRVAVMYAGRVVEEASVTELFERPRHPYTAGLLRSRPRLDVGRGRLVPIEGTVPDALHVPAGCAFHPRCPHAVARCQSQDPPLEQVGTHRFACWVTASRPELDLLAEPPR